MKKIVLIISMVLCASLFMGCANILEGLTGTDSKTEQNAMPSNGHYTITGEQRDGQPVPHITSGGAQIDGLTVQFKGGGFGGLTVQFADNGKFKFPNSDDTYLGATWKYHDNALWITRTDTETTVYKYEIV